MIVDFVSVGFFEVYAHLLGLTICGGRGEMTIGALNRLVMATGAARMELVPKLFSFRAF